MEKISIPSGFGSDFSERSDNAVLNGFSNENICGEGASCIVYKMRLGGLLLAVKRLRPELCGNPVFAASYRKEFHIGQRLKHDALPVYRELHEDSDEIYIVMDYVAGVSVQDFILTDEGKAYFSSEDNARRFFSELIGVLGYLHRSGVIHCDIKPANIMLRHSDRGVMLLDLDKSYSGTLDRTHGGTPDISDPLSSGDTPKAHKDYVAVGRLLEIIEGSVPTFPERKFRRFHKLCSQESIRPEILIEAIKKPSRSWYRLVGIVVVCLVCLVSVWRWLDASSEIDSQIEPEEAIRDTVVVIHHVDDTPVPAGNISYKRESGKPATAVVTVDDFDTMMSDVAQKAGESIKLLQSGNITDRAIQEHTNKAIDIYTSTYGELLSYYKELNPDRPSLEVELALAKASEQSNVSRLLQQFTQAAVDTLRKRNPELYDD